MGLGSVHLEAGVVDLVAAGIHGHTHLAGKARQVPGHGGQGRAAGAGFLRRPGQALGGGHPDAQPGEGTGPRRHGDEIHLGGGEAAGLQQVPGHGQQGLAVGQAGVEEGLGQEGFVLAQGHGGRCGGGFQG